MSLPNEHIARVRDPKDFSQTSFRSKDVEKGIRVIIGKLKGETGEDDPMIIESYHFSIDKFTEAEANAWLKDNDITYIKFEPATGDDEEEQIEEAIEGEDNMETENIKKFSCECIKCGHKMESDKHCKDILCSECGGEMRRAERPGPGRGAPEKQNKQFAISSFKSGKMDDGRIFIEGYANTKNKEDRYGDIPTVYPAKRGYVYELKSFLKHPVLLLDHDNSTGSIAGSFNPKYGGYIFEDNIGLKFKAIFSESDQEKVRHARTVYNEGHGRALSIGGKWLYENPDNPKQLTLADIVEISLVGIGADEDALTTKNGPKGIQSPYNEDVLMSKNNESGDHQTGLAEGEKAGRVLSKSNEGKIRNAQEMLTQVLSALSKEKEEDKQCRKILKLKLTKKN